MNTEIKINVPLTLSQIKNLIDYIEIDFIGTIRRDECIDNIDYILNIMESLRALRIAAAENAEATTEMPFEQKEQA